MSEFSPEEVESRKKAIFDSMGSRGRARIVKLGYDKWDPFLEPKDPIDIRKDKTKRTSKSLIREFLQNVEIEDYSNAYGQGALELCLGIINEEERFQGMYDFACWYRELLIKEGHE